MMNLNPRQRDAVRYLDGPLLVLAGAGSGKTAVITHKIAWLLAEGGYEPAQIAAVTFTNKAAREMKERVGKLLKAKAARGLTVSTFHTLGLNILRQDAALIGHARGFSIYDAEDSRTLLRELLRETAGQDGSAADQAQWRLSFWKNALVGPEQAYLEAEDDHGRALARLYAEYRRTLKARNAFDFDDLILKPVELFRTHPEALARWRGRLRYLLVDEYQDTNATQYLLLRQLTGERGLFTVVGDDDQSIYAFRGARPENLRQLQDDYPGLAVVKLEQNYRSSGRILKAANALIANNPHVFEKRLWCELGYGDPVRVMVVRNEEHEAERVVSALLAHRFSQRTRYADYAILYRGNHQARAFERVLREQRVPYFLSGGTSFFDRGEVRDALAYLRLITNPEDNGAFLRVVNTPRREIGAATLEKLSAWATAREVSLIDACFELGLAEQLGDRPLAALRRFAEWVVAMSDARETEPPAALTERLLSEIGYEAWLRDICDSEPMAERRMDNVKELVEWVRRLAAPNEEGEARTLTDVVARICLLGMLDSDEAGDVDQVSLMTLHAAKGLEFPHVFMVGMEENLLPHRSSIDEDNVTEERRLAYVGITRARRSLTFSLAARRKRYGEMVECEPSRFLSELPAEDLEWEGEAQEVAEEERQAHAQTQFALMRQVLGG